MPIPTRLFTESTKRVLESKLVLPVTVRPLVPPPFPTIKPPEKVEVPEPCEYMSPVAVALPPKSEWPETESGYAGEVVPIPTFPSFPETNRNGVEVP